MGQWVMHIEGTGAHHNGVDHDADAMIKAFVQQLVAQGQNIQATTFTYGSREHVYATTKVGDITTIDPKDVGKLFE